MNKLKITDVTPAAMTNMLIYFYTNQTPPEKVCCSPDFYYAVNKVALLTLTFVNLFY